MTSPPVISNTSPLIALTHLGQLSLLGHLFGDVWIPPAVVAETGPSFVLPAWLIVHPLAQQIDPNVSVSSLGAGESESISLALEHHARLVILDDRPARRLAQRVGLTVVGTLGILIAAKKRNPLPLVKPCLDALMQNDFRIAPRLYEQILLDSGE